MLQYERINVLEGPDFNKSNKSKECMICHHWYFKILVISLSHMFCNSCHDISMMVYELGNIAILNVKEFDYRCFIEYNLK